MIGPGLFTSDGVNGSPDLLGGKRTSTADGSAVSGFYAKAEQAVGVRTANTGHCDLHVAVAFHVVGVFPVRTMTGDRLVADIADEHIALETFRCSGCR